MSNFLENNKLEEAYKHLANEILDHAGDANWDKAISKYEIYNKMLSNEIYFFCGKKKFYRTGDANFELEDKASEAAYFIKDYFLENTGDRIWGFTFTLYPDGKLDIEFDYNKPEDYEESDEVITGEEINQTFLR